MPPCHSAAAAATRSWSTTSSTSPSGLWTNCGRECSTRTPSWWWTSSCSSSGRYEPVCLVVPSHQLQAQHISLVLQSSLPCYGLLISFFLELAASRWPPCAANTRLRNKIAPPPHTHPPNGKSPFLSQFSPGTLSGLRLLRSIGLTGWPHKLEGSLSRLL